MSDPKENPVPPGEDETAAAPETGSGDAPGADAPTGGPVGEDSAVEALQAEVADLKDKLLRAVAEAENTRKRAERDKQDASRYGITSFARDVLTVGDNMRRAIDSLSDADRDGASDSVKNLIAGIEMTEREFLGVLERHGVKAVNPMGEKFDPNLHQAMFEVDAADKPAGTVVQVVATGYVIGDRLLRPAMVGVAKGGGAGGGSGNGDSDGSSPGSTVDTKA